MTGSPDVRPEPITVPSTNRRVMQNEEARTVRRDDRHPTRIVIVLAKAPVAGRVKTRLTPPASPRGAARIAAAALLDTLEAARAVPHAGVLVALDGDLDAAERGAEIADALAGAEVVGQRGDTLGDRITAAHEDAVGRHPGAVTVQIGMDTPQVDATLLTDALDLVADGDADAALGLALDGGWWAMSLADAAHAAAIRDVPTSRDDTGPRTLAALRAGHPGIDPGRVLELPPLSDVDTAADAVTVADLVPHGRFAHAVRDELGASAGQPSSEPLIDHGAAR